MESLRLWKRSAVERVNQLKSSSELRRASRYDADRYLRSSSTLGPFRSRENLAAKITERYHAIEKGLSLPSPRPGFGAAVIETILRLCETYVREYGEDAVTRAAYGALGSYVAFNREAGLAEAEIPHLSRIELATATMPSAAPTMHGTKPMSKAELLTVVSQVGPDFFSTRHSTRVFDESPVSRDDIEFAASAAAAAPAVCNRQFGRVHVWTEPSKIAELLHIQGGARGFAEQIRCLAMITVSLRNYWGAAERNQAWIDGGLFGMNFLLGLHARGLGSVPLNWSKTPSLDKRMRAAAGLDDATGIVFLVGIGNLRDSYRVAASPRTQLPLTWHSPNPTRSADGDGHLSDEPQHP